MLLQVAPPTAAHPAGSQDHAKERSRLQKRVADVHGFLGPRFTMMLADNLHKTSSQLPEWLVATGCSGTDMPVAALQALEECWLEAFDVNLCVQHVFSCELDKKVRAFIEQHHKPRFLFEDMCELGRDHAVDLLSNDRVRIPS